VPDKIDFCRKYKFNITFENTPSLGYTTEKIMDAYAANAVPIYWGNPTIETDFHLESMVRVRDEADIGRAVSEIIRLDNDDDAYLRVAKARKLVTGIKDYTSQMEAFLTHIFSQPSTLARRRNSYGYQPGLQRNVSKVMRMDYSILQLRERFRKLRVKLHV